MRRFSVLLVALLLLAGVGLAASARADETLVSTTVLGARSIATVDVPALADGVASVVTSTVTETTATGDASWEVTMRLCQPDAVDSTVADCTAGTAMVNTLGAGSIPATALAVSNRAVLQVDGGGVSAAPTGSQTLEAARRLFQNTGQDPSAGPYTGTYTATSNVTLTLPHDTPAGVYEGFLVVDLVQ